MPFLEKLKSKKAEDYSNEKPPDYPAEAPTSKHAPPSYAPADALPETIITELNSALLHLNLSSSKAPSFPEADYCLAHLKLLAAFHGLKREIGYTDGLFGIEDSCCEKTENRAEALASLKEKRWNLFVARAVDRFQDWWLKILCPREDAVRLTCGGMSKFTGILHFADVGQAQTWTTAMLPPLDVLMVWHTFMLNPRNYYEDCVKVGLKDLWATGLPWAAVNEVIDAEFNYNIPDEGKAHFVNVTERNWDNSDDSSSREIRCPRCHQQNQVPWTTCTEPRSLDFKNLTGSGYGDRDFAHACISCNRVINHELLCVDKFKKDAENLLLNDWPLAGTILNRDGTVLSESEHTDFVNRLVKMELRIQVLELIEKNEQPNMDDVKRLIEKAIQDKSLVRRVKKDSSGLSKSTVQTRDAIAIRRMMKKYWDNPTIFSIELGGAVIRQSLFVEKMQGIDWLHSPSAKAIMDRLLLKYRRFLALMADFPLQVVVPTLDVDLAWHTHQLSPKQYYEQTTLHCKKFVDHDDKISEDKISEYFEWTSKTYQKLYKEVYSECTCWYCEAIRASHSDTNVFGSSKIDKPVDDFYASGQAQLCSPDKSAHISTHNVVRISETPMRAKYFNRLRDSKRHSLNVAYNKACRKATKKGRKAPDKNQFYYDYWGNPYLFGYPFAAVPVGVDGYYYAGDTASMPAGHGMHGGEFVY